MTSGVQFFKQNMPTQTVAGRLSAGAGPVEALTISDVATQVALALIANTIPHSFATLPGTPSTPTTWGALVGAIEAAQSWTISSSNIYTAATAYYTALPGLSGYYGLLWLTNKVGGSDGRRVDIFQLGAQASPIDAVTNGGDLVYVFGHFFEELLPPGYAAVIGNTIGTSGNLYRVPFDSPSPPVEYVALGYDGVNYDYFSNSANTAALWTSNISAGGVSKITVLNWPAHTCTVSAISVGGFSNPRLAANPGAIDGRMYVAQILDATPGRLGWLNIDSNAYTQIATWTNKTNQPLVGGPFYDSAGQHGTAVFVQSGTNNKADKIQKLGLDGALIAEGTLTNVTNTAYGSVTVMAFDYVNNHLWAQSAVGIHCFECGGMTELAFIASGSLAAILIGPIGHPSGGAIALTNSGLTISRLSLSAA